MRELKICFNLKSTDISISSDDDFTEDELICLEKLNSNFIGEIMSEKTIMSHAYGIRNSINDCKVKVVNITPKVVYEYNYENIIAEI